MMDQGKNSSLKAAAKFCNKAFTLIELLVVIAIIGLLLAIVMPALRKAKGAAESVVCRAHERGIGAGLITYTSANKDWIPGPSTSGANPMALPGFGSMTPYQNVDWISPSLGTDIGLPDDPTQRLLSILNSKLKCPSNKVKYDYIYPSGVPGLDPKTISYSSYSAVMGFHMYPSKGAGSSSTLTTISGKRILTDWQVYNHFNIAKGYVPKLNSIGTPSSKIFAIDGARYYSATQGTSFNTISYQDDGGNFMLHGISYLMNGDPLQLVRTVVGSETILKPKEETLKLSFRHDGRINAVFFDGHCQTLTPEQAVKSSYYWPRDTYVTSNAPGYALNQDPYLAEGHIR